MKKTISIILTISLLFAISSAVFAANIPSNKNVKDATVSYTEKEVDGKIEKTTAAKYKPVKVKSSVSDDVLVTTLTDENEIKDEWEAKASVSTEKRTLLNRGTSYSSAGSYSTFACDTIHARTALFVDDVRVAADYDEQNDSISAVIAVQVMQGAYESAYSLSYHKFEKTGYVSWYPELTAGPVYV